MFNWLHKLHYISKVITPFSKVNTFSAKTRKNNDMLCGVIVKQNIGERC